MRQPFTQTSTNDGTVRYFCRCCSAYLHIEAFYPSMIREKRRVCRTHWDKRRWQQKHGTDVASLLASLRTRLRGHPEWRRQWTRDAVVRVLHEHGASPPYFNRGRVCIVASDPDLPLTPQNAKPMPVNVCRGRRHLRRRRA